MTDENTLQTSEKNGSSPQCPANPRRILVADDDIHMRKLSALALSHSGYHVVEVEDGGKGWEALHANHFDLLITDNDMPVLTGVELVRKLRDARMAVPVILATAVGPTEELQKHPWLHIAATLLKPFTVHELLGTVEKVLRAIEGPGNMFKSPPDGQSQPADG